MCDAVSVVGLSAEGASVERHTAWPVGTTRLMTIRDGAQQVRVEAECVHSESSTPDLFHLGLRFLDLEPDDRAALEELAARHADY